MTDLEKARKVIGDLCLTTDMEQSLAAAMDAYRKEAQRATMIYNGLQPRLIHRVLDCAIEALENGQSAFDFTIFGKLDNSVSEALTLLGLTWTVWNDKHYEFEISLDAFKL